MLGGPQAGLFPRIHWGGPTKFDTWGPAAWRSSRDFRAFASGAAVEVMKFWKDSSRRARANGAGWVVETYPIISSITFQDVARTKAAVAIIAGYSGATVIMEKQNGTWRALRLVNQWIT